VTCACVLLSAITHLPARAAGAGSTTLSLTATARWHDNVLAYSSPPRPDLIAQGKPLTLSATFDRAAPLVAYYFDARTVACELHTARSLGPRLALVLTAEIRDTTHGNASYQNRLASAGLVRAF